MTHKQAAFAATVKTIMKNLEKRGMEGYFFEDSASCTDAILASNPENSTMTVSAHLLPKKEGNYMPNRYWPIIIL